MERVVVTTRCWSAGQFSVREAQPLKWQMAEAVAGSKQTAACECHTGDEAGHGDRRRRWARWGVSRAALGEKARRGSGVCFVDTAASVPVAGSQGALGVSRGGSRHSAETAPCYRATCCISSGNSSAPRPAGALIHSDAASMAQNGTVVYPLPCDARTSKSENDPITCSCRVSAA